MIGHYRDGGAIISRLQKTLRKRGKGASRPDASENDQFLLRQVVENLIPYVKIIQGIFLSRGIKDNEIDLFDLARELLDMKPGLDLESFKKDGLEGLSKELKGMIGKIADVCAAEGRKCGDIDEMKVVLLNVDNVSKRLVENYFKMYQDGETLPNLVVIKNDFPQISQLHQLTGSLINALKTARNETVAQQDPFPVGVNIMSPLKELSKAPDLFKTKFSAQQIESLSKNNLVAKLNAMKTLGIVHSDLDKIKYDVLIAKFEGFKELILISESHLSDKKQWPMIEKKLSMMTALVDSKLEIEEKHFTSAFLNGFKDLTRLLQESESSFVKETVLKGADPRKLIEELAPLESLHKNVKPIHDVLEKAKDIGAAELKIKTMVNEATADVEDLKKMEPLHNCISGMQNFNLTIDSNSWFSEATYAEALGDHAKTFAEKYNQISFELPVYKQLVEKVTSSANIAVGDVIQYVQKHQNYDQLVKEVQTLQDCFGQLMTKEMKKWIGQTRVHELVPEAKQWLENTDAGKTLQCIQDKEIAESIKNILGKQIVLPAIQQMKPSDESIVDVENAEKLVKEAYEQYVKWMNSHRNRKARAAEKQERVKQSIQTTDNLAIAVQFYADVASAYLLEEEIQKLMAFGQTIDDAIERLKDQDKKIRMKKMWNGKTKEALKSLPKVVEDFTKSIVSLPEKLEDYQKVFNVTSFDSLDGDINMKVFLEELRSMNSLLIDQPTAQKLETLDLAFSNAKQKRLNGYQAFILSLPILSAFQPPQNSIGDTKNFLNLKPEELIAIVSVFVVGVTILVFFGLWLYNCQNLKGENRKMRAFKKIFPCCFREEKALDVDYYRTVDGQLVVKAKTNTGIDPKNNVSVEKTKDKKDKSAERETKGMTLISTEEAKKIKKKMNKKEKKIVENLEIDATQYSEVENKFHAFFRQPPQENDHVIVFKERTEQDLERKSRFEYNDDDDVNREFVGEVEFKLPEKEYMIGHCKDRHQLLTDKEKVDDRGEASTKKHKTAKCYKKEDEELLSTSNRLQSAKTARSISAKTFAKSISSPSEEATQETEEPIQIPERISAGLDKEYDDDYEREPVGTRGVKAIKDMHLIWDKDIDAVIRTAENAKNIKPFPKRDILDYTDIYFGKDTVEKKNDELNYLLIQSRMSSLKVLQYTGYEKEMGPEIINPLFPFRIYMKILRDAINQFKNDHALLKLARKKLRVVGDIHGAYADMVRHVELGFEEKDSSYLFLGDYVDRGPRSIDALIYMCVLKMTNPKRFHFLRGNHEMRTINSKWGFLEECIMVFGRTDGIEFWKLANEMFQEMPVACIIGKKIWAAHGGISPLMLEGRAFIEDNLKKRPTTTTEWKLFSDVLWSDPAHFFGPGNNMEILFPSSERTATASNFTPEGLNMVLKECNFAFIIRGHQAVKNGFEISNNGKCITTFGATDHYTDGSLACQTIINDDMKVQFILFKNYDTDANFEEDVVTIADDKTDSNSKDAQASKTTAPPKKNESPSPDSKSKAKPSRKLPSIEGQDAITKISKSSASKSTPTKPKENKAATTTKPEVAKKKK